MKRSIMAASMMTAFVLMAGCGEAPGAQAGGQTATPEKPAKGAPTEDDVKAVIKRRVESLATGVGSSHKSVEVTFQAVQFGETRALNEQDKIDGVRGETVYPVRAKYSELRAWGNGETETVETYYAYDFYRDEFGEWNFVGLGPVR